MKLYHTSNLELKNPDVNYGRRNADFGGGFYLSDNPEFSQKWASDQKSIVNEYTLDLTGLAVKRFSLDAEWFKYISQNRAGFPDAYGDTDVIIGPIANDTLYDTYGIITSGLVSSEDSLKLLSVGKRYVQLNIKTEKAAAQLRWEGAKQLSTEEIAASQNALRAEEKEFREAFWSALSELDNFAEIEAILS
ncbi:MAG: DUF3990 domain-containing protein [Eubacterium sp.]|nr:DUF3990 domain-containing protein [Eubacterium sp.]MBR0412260.1 DUF3990 domain-containing protein [Eubacterium sp.]